MNQGVDDDDEERVHKCDQHPDVDHLDVGGLRERVKDRDEERCQREQSCCIDCYNGLKHFISNIVVS